MRKVPPKQQEPKCVHPTGTQSKQLREFSKEPKLTVPTCSVQKYIAGNIKFHIPRWLTISQDRWIQQVVRGYVIDFSVHPPPRFSCPSYHMSREQEKALDQEVAEMVTKKVIEEVNPQEMHFISPMFVVPKKGGKWRPVLNLKSLNQYVKKTHFKMEDIRKRISSRRTTSWPS